MNTISPSLVHQVATSSCSLETTTSSANGSLCGRAVAAVETGSSVATLIFDKTNALFKFFKFAGGSIQVASLYVSEGTRKVLEGVGRDFKEVEGILGFAQLVDRVSYFTSKKHLKESALKTANAFFIVIAKSAEVLMWCAKRSVVNLGALASAIGGTAFFNLTQKVALASVKGITVAIAASCSIADTAITLAKKGTKSLIKPCLTFVEESGKIALCVGNLAATPVAFVALMTGTAGFAKVLYAEYGS